MNPCRTQFLTAWQDTNEEMFKKILLELNILKDCNHKRVVAFYGSYQYQRSQIRICMEYMDGGSLDKVSFPLLSFFNLFSGHHTLWEAPRVNHWRCSCCCCRRNDVYQGILFDSSVLTILWNPLERARYYPPRYQTVKYSLQHSRRHQTLRFRRLWPACQ